LIRNDNNKLIPIQVEFGWCTCRDYRKLIAATSKDHFSLPFLDQMLEMLAGHSF